MKTLENNLRYEVRENNEEIIISKFRGNDKIAEKSFKKSDGFSYDWEKDIEENLEVFKKIEIANSTLLSKVDMLRYTISKLWVSHNNKKTKESTFLGEFENVEQLIERVRDHRSSVPAENLDRYIIGYNGRVRSFFAFTPIQKFKEKLN